jgi:polar amino acid transport system substrate-binding protein
MNQMHWFFGGVSMWKTLLLALLLVCSAQSHAARIWRVASLEWPPFSGKNLPEGGAGIAILRAALAAKGVELAVEFFPWTRAMLTSRAPDYAGLYPAWPEDVRPGFLSSPVLFRSPVGFVELKSNPLIWTKLEDLAGKKIGIVQDYGNTPEFMDLVGKGTLTTELAIDDLTNIRKVAARRIDAAFIDLNNLSYFLKYDAQDLADLVQANVKVIENKDLVLAINPKFDDKSVNLTLTRGLSKIKPDRILKEYLERNFKF